VGGGNGGTRPSFSINYAYLAARDKADREFDRSWAASLTGTLANFAAGVLIWLLACFQLDLAGERRLGAFAI
jgi:hypothetical protein